MIINYREKYRIDGRRMSQTQLANLLGVTQKHISQIERGIQPITRVMAQRLHVLEPEIFDETWVLKTILHKDYSGSLGK